MSFLKSLKSVYFFVIQAANERLFCICIWGWLYQAFECYAWGYFSFFHRFLFYFFIFFLFYCLFLKVFSLSLRKDFIFLHSCIRHFEKFFWHWLMSSIVWIALNNSLLIVNISFAKLVHLVWDSNSFAVEFSFLIFISSYCCCNIFNWFFILYFCH